MRLVCPNCEAKYEVPDDAIPDTGRDVQCTNCGHSWYQMRGRTGAAPLVASSSGGPALQDPSGTVDPIAASQSQSPVQEPGTVDAGMSAAVTAPDADATAPADDAFEAVATGATVGGSEPGFDGSTFDDPAADISGIVAEPTVDGDAATSDASPGALVEVAEDLPGSKTDPVVASGLAVAAEAEPISSGDPVAAGDETATAAAPVDQTIADLIVAADLAGSGSGPAAAHAADDDIPAPAPEYAVDESVLAILREEAEREANARRAEVLESQTDLGIDAAMPRKSAAHASEAEAKASARRDLLPDVEEINSTLRPSEIDAADGGTPDFAPAPPEAPRGFRSGFLTLMTIAILATALYIVAPRLAVLVPGLAGPLESYVSMVDSLRLGLDGMMRSATVAISDG